MSNDLLKQIDDLVASKTFNLDALDGIKQLKDDLQKQITETEWVAKKLKDETARCEELSKLNSWQGNKIAALNKTIEDNEAAATKAREAIHEAEKHKAVAEAFKFSLETVFKPATVRETVYQSIPLSQNYNGNTSVMPYQQETKTTKEEL
jgi:chromosome segregation ATPase